MEFQWNIVLYSTKVVKSGFCHDAFVMPTWKCNAKQELGVRTVQLL